jgi:hypothetical protein
LAIEVEDMRLGSQFPELPQETVPFYGPQPLVDREITGLSFLPLFERLTELVVDADTYPLRRRARDVGLRSSVLHRIAELADFDPF